MDKIKLKNPDEIKIMAEGGKILAEIKKKLIKEVKAGVTAAEIDELAFKLIKEAGVKPSFTTVGDYKWATCINVNDGVVHGIPHPTKVFKDGDVVSVDVGILHKGFHTDTSLSTAINPTPEVKKFLSVGRRAFDKALSKARVGNHIYDISKAMQEEVEAAGYNVIRALVGHGVGRELHEEPQIPCFVPGRITESPKIVEGMVIAIEVMYVMGSPLVEQDLDGWTIVTRDGKIAGLFEDTVAILASGPKVLTA